MKWSLCFNHQATHQHQASNAFGSSKNRMLITQWTGRLMRPKQYRFIILNMSLLFEDMRLWDRWKMAVAAVVEMAIAWLFPRPNTVVYGNYFYSIPECFSLIRFCTTWKRLKCFWINSVRIYKMERQDGDYWINCMCTIINMEWGRSCFYILVFRFRRRRLFLFHFSSPSRYLQVWGWRFRVAVCGLGALPWWWKLFFASSFPPHKYVWKTYPKWAQNEFQKTRRSKTVSFIGHVLISIHNVLTLK